MGAIEDIRSIRIIDTLSSDFDSVSFLVRMLLKQDITEKELIERVTAGDNITAMIDFLAHINSNSTLQSALAVSWLQYARQDVVERGVDSVVGNLRDILLNQLAEDDILFAKYEETDEKISARARAERAE